MMPLFAHGIGLEFAILLELALAVAGASSVAAFFAAFFPDPSDVDISAS